MKIKLIIYGALRAYVRSYQHEGGMWLELPDSTTAGSMIERLGIPAKLVGLVSANGENINLNDVMPDNSTVKVFQRISGG